MYYACGGLVTIMNSWFIADLKRNHHSNKTELKWAYKVRS